MQHMTWGATYWHPLKYQRGSMVVSSAWCMSVCCKTVVQGDPDVWSQLPLAVLSQVPYPGRIIAHDSLPKVTPGAAADAEAASRQVTGLAYMVRTIIQAQREQRWQLAAEQKRLKQRDEELDVAQAQVEELQRQLLTMQLDAGDD